MTGYLLLASGVLVLWLGLWSKGRDSPYWRSRLFTGFVIIVSGMYFILHQ
jgi:hypothetical protein